MIMSKSKGRETRKPRAKKATTPMAGPYGVVGSLEAESALASTSFTEKESTPRVPSFAGYMSSTPSEIDAGNKDLQGTEDVEANAAFERDTTAEGMKDLRSRRRKITVVMVTFAIGAVVATYLAITGLMSKPPRPIRACSSVDCSKAMLYITGIVNHTVDPCDNFYEYVCSRWLSAEGRPSFLEEVRTSFDRRSIEVLLHGYHKDHAVQFVSRFFRSCHAFFGSVISLDVVLRRFFETIAVPMMMDGRNFTAILSTMFRLSYRARYHTVLKVRLETSDNDTTMVHIGKGGTLQDHFFGTHDQAEIRAFLSTIIGTITSTTINDSIVTETLELDGTLNQALSSSSDGVRSYSIQVGDMQQECAIISAQEWLNMIKSNVPRWLPSTVRSFVRLTSFNRTCTALYTLHGAPDKVRAVYVATHLALNLLKYAFHHGSQLPKPADTCFQLTAEIFSPVWGMVLGRIFLTAQASRRVDALFSQLIEKLTGVMNRSLWLSVDDRIAVNGMLKEAVLKSFSKGLHADISCTRINFAVKLIASDFVANFVRVSLKAPGSCDDFAFRKEEWTYEALQKASTIAYVMESRALVLPTAYLAPPTFYPELSEALVNTAPIETLLATALLKEVLFRGPSMGDLRPVGENWWMTRTTTNFLRLEKCYLEQLSIYYAYVRNPAWSTQYYGIFTSILTLQAVHEIQEAGARAGRERYELQRAFFSRFCLPYCPGNYDADAQESRMYSCLLPVMNDELFHETFNCSRMSRMTPKEKCEF
ncbi:uncharacterized protein LOC135385615 isoform X2 [Ornithodoros turicata]|uniref:uncharacterized protein LOC135385615 isoform X2 n=1 Tax=Ornithodoros turicata TaxID=34597 RepID=UPI00313A4543